MTLRHLLSTGECLLAPGVYDCLTARLAECAGFGALAISGYAVEAGAFGLPDLGFTGLSDIADVADRIVDAVSIPVICDADTGFGGGRNVWRTVRRLEKAGVQGLHIEDQRSPKKCGGMTGRDVVPIAEMLGNIRAALDARRSDDLLIIARTDAKERLGVEAVIERLNRYLEAGADVAFAAEPYSTAEIERLGREVNGKLAICVGIPGWDGSFERLETYGRFGVALAVAPFLCLYPAAKAISEALQRTKAENGISPALARHSMVGFADFNRLMGTDEWAEREARFERNEPASK